MRRCALEFPTRVRDLANVLQLIARAWLRQTAELQGIDRNGHVLDKTRYALVEAGELKRERATKIEFRTAFEPRLHLRVERRQHRQIQATASGITRITQVSGVSDRGAARRRLWGPDALSICGTPFQFSAAEVSYDREAKHRQQRIAVAAREGIAALDAQTA